MCPFGKARICRAVISAVAAIMFVFFLSATIVRAETAESQDSVSSTVKSDTAGPSDPEELEVFLDQYFKEKMDAYKIPGLIFVLVKDGDIFFSKGFGYADLAEKRPVVPDQTLFRVGSVAKLFTATAVMQLYEQGRIQLDADVNKYLINFHLDDEYPQAVTVANLLTHTAGFRGGAIGSSIRNESDVMSLEDYVSARAMSPALPPGEVINYSNYGYNLAGYLVQEISGKPFADYVSQHILEPLDMRQSSFDLEPDDAIDLAKSYTFEGGGYRVIPYEYGLSWPSPCGSLTSTGNDIAHFMIAHLQNGRYGDNQILSAETTSEMHKQQFTNYPKLPGLCYGFYEYYGNNLRAIMHDGDVSGFSSRLFLIPAQDVGFFVCYNGGPSAFRMLLTTTLLNRYFPSSDSVIAPQPPADFDDRAKLFAGGYRPVPEDLNTLDKLRTVSDLVNINVGDHALTWPNAQSRWVEVEPLLFQYVGSKTPRMAFRQNSDGAMTYLFLDFQQIPLAYERVNWYDMPTFTWGSLCFFSFVFLSSFVIWPIMRRSRHRQAGTAGPTQPHRVARIVAITAVVLNSLFIIGYATFMSYFIDELEYGVPIPVKALLVLPIVSAILAVALIVFALLSWGQRNWGRFERWHYSLVTLTCVALIIWAYHWNILGFHY